MDEIEGNLIGYKSFLSKAGKQCYVVSVLFTELDSVNSRLDYYVVDIFCKSEIYNSIVSDCALLGTVYVKREVVKDKVYYSF